LRACRATSFGSFGEGYLRLSYANSQDNIRKALQRIADYLAQREARTA
jgi:aspartate/methionine/tyrosine aminotransferase